MPRLHNVWVVMVRFTLSTTNSRDSTLFSCAVGENELSKKEPVYWGKQTCVPDMLSLLQEIVSYYS